MASHLINYTALGNNPKWEVQPDQDAEKFRVYDTLNGHTVIPYEGGWQDQETVMAEFEALRRSDGSFEVQADGFDLDTVEEMAEALVHSFLTLGESPYSSVEIYEGHGSDIGRYGADGEIVELSASVTELGQE